MTSNKKHLIIGSGPAALNAAGRIRSLNQDDEITLISREQTLPYSPAILPYLLAGRTSESVIWLRDEAYFRNANIAFVRGKSVLKVNPAKHQVTYRDGSADEYDSLLIASGAEPVTPQFNGFNIGDYVNFRTLDDYHRLNGLLKKGTRVAVLGAGMIAVELAFALAERGAKVQIIGRGRPLRAQFDEKAGKYINDIFIGNGVEISTGKTINQITKSGNTLEVRCAEGDVFKADILVSCLGVKPGLSFLENSGIATNQGILVDNQMRTNIDSIYAAGDVVEALDFFTNQPGISAILPSAISQGKVAGANMSGEKSFYPGWISMNQFKFFGNSACSIGISIPQANEGEASDEYNDANRLFKRLVFSGKRLIGAMFVNVDIDPGIIRYLIENKLDVSVHKDNLFKQPREISRWLMMENERRSVI